MKNKHFTHATILALIVLAIGCAFYFGMKGSAQTKAPAITSASNDTPSVTTSTETNTATSTQGTLTYASSKYGVLMTYPSGWSVVATSTPDIGSISLSNKGYGLIIQACTSTQSCYSYEKNSSVRLDISTSTAVILHIGGQQAWRDAMPAPNGEGGSFYFDFYFPKTSSSRTNDLSEVMSRNGVFYRINYELPFSATATSYDKSMISQMDSMVQSIMFTPPPSGQQ